MSKVKKEGELRSEMKTNDKTVTVETGTMALTGCRGPAFWVKFEDNSKQ